MSATTTVIWRISSDSAIPDYAGNRDRQKHTATAAGFGRELSRDLFGNIKVKLHAAVYVEGTAMRGRDA